MAKFIDNRDIEKRQQDKLNHQQNQIYKEIGGNLYQKKVLPCPKVWRKEKEMQLSMQDKRLKKSMITSVPQARTRLRIYLWC